MAAGGAMRSLDDTSHLVPADDQEPLNSVVSPMLTDMYQITMAYAYWNAGKDNDYAVFELFFRKNPFFGEYTVFAGLEEAIRLLQTFRFTEDDIEYLRSVMPSAEAGFFDYLRGVNCSAVRVYAMPEGTIVFPREPLIRIEGPLAVCQLLETPLLNLCNFASLMATNACRFRLAAGHDKELLEFGARRAQGPDGAMSASRYSFMGGFDGTSNVAAGKRFAMNVRGTHAHSFVSTFTSFDDLATREIKGVDAVARCLELRAELGFDGASDSELAAFIAYAQAFPDAFLALVDTYDTLQSGVPNFICVALLLEELGHKAVGVRLDSGDLAYLSKEARQMFRSVDEQYQRAGRRTSVARCKIVASNNINENVLHSLNDQGHEIDVFGIGTNLVTCQAQPALGMVYKLVEINGKARIKVSQEISKVTIPGAKEVFRLIGRDNVPILDILQTDGEARPSAGRRILCRHPFEEKKRVFVTPTRVLPMLSLAWLGNDSRDRADYLEELAEKDEEVRPHVIPPTRPAAQTAGTNLRIPFLPISDVRDFVRSQVDLLREDHLRPLNPTPYKVSVSAGLYLFTHDLWGQEVPIPELE